MGGVRTQSGDSSYRVQVVTIRDRVTIYEFHLSILWNLEVVPDPSFA